MELDIQLFGGRGASSSKIKTKKAVKPINKAEPQKEEKKQVEKTETRFSNKKSIIDFVKEQINVDLSKVIEPATARSRTYLGVQLNELSINDRNNVVKLLKYDKGLRIESNGGYGYAIWYKKNKK